MGNQTSQENEIEKYRAEVELLRADVARLQQYEPVIRGQVFDPANITIQLACGFMAELVRSFDAMNKDANYTVTNVKTAGGNEYEVTVRRTDKPTPHQLRADAEIKLKAAQTEIERLKDLIGNLSVDDKTGAVLAWICKDDPCPGHPTIQTACVSVSFPREYLDDPEMAEHLADRMSRSAKRHLLQKAAQAAKNKKAGTDPAQNQPQTQPEPHGNT